MKQSRKLISIILCIAMLVAASATLIGCKPTEPPYIPGEKETFYTEAVDREGSYTLRGSAGRPITLNPHMSNYSADSDIMQYIQSGLFTRGWDISTLDSDNPTFEWYNDMAAAEPVDITASLTSAQKAKYGIPSDATKGYAWEFEIRNDLKWQDGTAINAQTYVDSMELCLNPKYLNFRATEYWSKGKQAIANGKYYANKGWYSYTPMLNGDWESNFDPNFVDVDGATVYYEDISALLAAMPEGVKLGVSISKPNWWYSDVYGYAQTSIKDRVEQYFFAGSTSDYNGNGITVGDGDRDDMDQKLIRNFNSDVNLATYEWLLSIEDGQGYINIAALNAAEQLRLEKFFRGLVSRTGTLTGNETYWFTFFFGGVELESKDFDQVGIYKTSEYKFVYVLETANTMFEVKSGIDGWLVKPDLYKAGETSVGGVTISKYGSSKATVQSYGPYKLDVYDITANTIELSRNTNWFGWNDSKFDNQYQTSNIVLDIDSTYDQLYAKFMAGMLDGIGLQASNYDTYKDSEYLHYAKTMSTWSLFFNSNKANLAAVEAKSTNSVNLVALSNADFRKAISLAINRRDIGKYEIGSSPAFTVLNSLFIYNIENDPNSIYRNQRISQEVIAKAYNIANYETMTDAQLTQAVRAITGYDKDQATQLFKDAFNALKNDPAFDPAKPVKMQVYVPVGGNPLSSYPRLIGENEVIQKCLEEAIVGTGFVGISLEYASGSSNVYKEFRAGELEMLYGSFTGDRLDPFGFLACYAGGDLDTTKGWSGVFETKIAITADFDLNPSTPDITISKTPFEWQQSIEIGDYSTNQTLDGYHLRLIIATHLETWINSTSLVCPLYADGGISIYSKRIIFVTHEQHPVLDFGGGVRWRRYAFTDAEWTTYVASLGGNLSDIYK